MARRARLKTMSGFPATVRRFFRYRSPSSNKARQRITSGLVFVERLWRLAYELASEAGVKPVKLGAATLGLDVRAVIVTVPSLARRSLRGRSYPGCTAKNS